MRKHFTILVEYDPKRSIDDRQEIDRAYMKMLAEQHPQGKIVKMARKLISDYRAKLFAVIEWK
jgi:hypothetical protein